MTKHAHSIWRALTLLFVLVALPGLTSAAECTGTMLVAVQGDFFNEVSAIYAACPGGAGEALGCGESSYIVPVSMGSEYRIRVGSADGSTGEGSVSINCIPGSEPCDGDCNGDGVVNVDDVLEMLGDYGGSSSCDTNGDGVIGVDDLLTQIANWGDC